MLATGETDASAMRISSDGAKPWQSEAWQSEARQNG